MRRRILLVVASGATALLVVACARAPEPRSNATADSNVEPSADAAAAPLTDASTGAPLTDARVPGLPMPQQFPRVVWDAAGPPRDR